MARTLTKYVNFQTLQARGDSANIVIKLMMACNDLSLANQSLLEWKKELSRSKKPRQIGARMYFVRTQFAHLHEGMKVISEIKECPVLMALVDRCDSKTQRSFQELEQFLHNGSTYDDFHKLVGCIMHNLTFHYDQSGRQIKQAISDRAGRPEARFSSVSRGDTAYLWHFKVADDVVDSIVVRQIWKIPRAADARVEVDKISDQLHQILLRFVDFSGEFIWKYCES